MKVNLSIYMKKVLYFVFVMFFVVLSATEIQANTKNINFQAAWITTAWNIDWPSKKNSIKEQKDEMIKILDTFKDTGINTIMFQVRQKADALYSSSINPWADVLTGTQGKDPGYDPLEFVIEEANKRGIAVYAWLNPYRITHESDGTDVNKLSVNHPARKNPSWVIEHNNKLYYNPELPEVKQHISDTVAEIVRNYDVDGIVFDDYFYPTDYPLPAGEHKDGHVANSRRNHISETILKVKNTIKNIDSSVKFGVSPRGVWKNKNSDPKGSDTGYAKESYYSDYADTVKWIEEGYIDYIIPQVYWEMNHSVAPYNVVTDWWVDIVKGTNVELYIGHTTDKDVVAAEIDKQINYNKQYSTIKGDSYYNTKSLMTNNQNSREKIKESIKSKTIVTDIKGHWAETEIMDFLNKGYVNGYNDSTFRPNKSITRAEFIKIVNKVFGYSNKAIENFSDVNPGAWYYDEVCIAIYEGYIDSNQTKFRPNDTITRQEAAAIITSIMKCKDSNLDKIEKYIDYYKVANWALSSVEGAIERGYMGVGSKEFRPTDNVTRAEAVVMLSRIS